MPTTSRASVQLPPRSHVDTLAVDLIRALAEHAGDEEAVQSILVRWLDTIGHRDLSLVCIATVRDTFGHCLIPHPDRIPADGLTLDPTRAGQEGTA